MNRRILAFKNKPPTPPLDGFLNENSSAYQAKPTKPRRHIPQELRAYQADVATVLRNGCFSIVPATDLVPGDIVEVSVGCKVPADLRMIEILSNQLRVDQAILTGESCSVEKELDATTTTNAVYQDKTNILFSVSLFHKRLELPEGPCPILIFMGVITISDMR
ncbi:unnamed protein product [Cuscuta campestris]|uniref:P-type ATPase A domain-containing protein n=1 Tax=Cuscuta campestris TaxID=132261 RepID=A0A484NC27_9ASTE|nr:unnamed protein product [Cuscuta campestris]